MMTMAVAESAVRSSASTAADLSESRVDKDSHFNGLYETKQNLRIEGLAEGEIQCEGTLTVAEGARVKAKVTASTITIAGELDGEVLCHGVFQIMPSGQVSASVSARRLIVQEGGLYNGEFRMITEADTRLGHRNAGPAVDKGTASSDSKPADAGSTDEWWRKLTGDSADHPAGEDGASEARATDEGAV